MGHLGFKLFTTTIGLNGTKLFLSGVCLVSILFIFDISVKDLFTVFSMAMKKTTNAENPKKKSLLLRIAHALFFTTQPAAPKNRYNPSSLKKPSYAFDSFPEAEISAPSKHEASSHPVIEEVKEPIETTLQTPKIVSLPKKNTTPLTDSNYQYPDLSLLEKGQKKTKPSPDVEKKNQERAKILEMTLESFNVEAKVVHVILLREQNLDCHLTHKIPSCTAIARLDLDGDDDGMHDSPWTAVWLWWGRE